MHFKDTDVKVFKKIERGGEREEARINLRFKATTQKLY